MNSLASRLGQKLKLLGLDLHGCTDMGTHVSSPASTSNNDAGRTQPDTSVETIAVGEVSRLLTSPTVFHTALLSL